MADKQPDRPARDDLAGDDAASPAAPEPERHAPAEAQPATAEPSPEVADTDDEYDDVYTAEMACKCGKQLAANAWFCPRCGRVYLLNMLFALVVLAMGFALLNQLVEYVLKLLSRAGQ